jgi:TolA-binding protein
MKRTIYCGAVVVLIAVIATSSYSQVQRPRVRASRQPSQSSGGQASGMSSMQGQGGGTMDPNMTPQQRMAQHQQEMQQRMAEMQRQMDEMQRQAEESRNNAIRQMLSATDEQWPRIKPKLDLIDRLKAEASVSADPGSSGGAGGFQSGGTSFQNGGTSFGGGFMGGWASGGGAGGGGGMMDSSGRPQTWSQSKTWGSGSNRKKSANATDGEVLCEQLLRDLQTPGTPPADIVQRVAALRKIRAQAQNQLALVRRDLRSVILPAQEPALVTMGYLD